MTDKIGEKALSSLGRGFDLTSDFRLKFCKGKKRLVLLNELETRELAIPGFGPLQDVSVDVKCDKGDRTRYQSDILEFHKMSELFNQRSSSILGKIPSGLFNAMFEFNGGSWASDAAKTKYLGLDGYYISLFNLHIDRYPLILSDDVRNAVPHFWDPAALARFIRKYGTHIIVGLSIGGQDVLLVRQDKSSNLEPSELKKHLNDLGDQLFTGTCAFSPIHHKLKENRKAPPKAFKEFELEQPSSFTTFSNNVTSKEGITLISSKRGGTSTSSHCDWLLTVPYRPDAINFSFIPITSLLKGVPGKGFLSHAINLYLRYKPPINELEYFLDFQSHRLWAPIHNDLRLGPTTNMTTIAANPSLNFNFMGPKVYVNPNQVVVGKRPVTGMRLFLEGMKCNRLAIHLQHLSSTPMMLLDKIQDTSPLWTSFDEAQDPQFFEPIQGKKFSHVCTKPVTYSPSWTSTTTHFKNDVAFIVTGAQLLVKKHQNAKKVLHLRLHFSKVNDSCIVQSIWAQGHNGNSQKSGFFSSITTSIARGGVGGLEKGDTAAVVVDSGVFPGGPPVGQSQKLMKFVDTKEVCRGPQDNPGHWLVTGAKLELDKGKINLHVKFSLLNTNLSSNIEREEEYVS